jgi:hypothetical protein
VLELGANVGYFSVQGGQAVTSACYVAVEPHPISHEVCRSNLDLNGVASVQVIAAAATADPSVSSIQLHVPADQRALPTVAFLAADSELPPGMGKKRSWRLTCPRSTYGPCSTVSTCSSSTSRAKNTRYSRPPAVDGRVRRATRSARRR